ncbi:MAG: hypothetical protein K1563_07830 [Candidatus Thiodiazotropha sp. (ex. Lucinisca nassula)]|nr:hypothetical protein [Candidatus Thiodiazotropha sp. (ex. Lucinisca nassula)]MBW9273583.1 hypothetical protein [Candidatus Thiodiazotropha sp. (ex. Lucinisca nassula)]
MSIESAYPFYSSTTAIELERGAVLALESTRQRIYRIDVIRDLLKGMESGAINYDDDITGGITLMTVVVETLDNAMSNAFEDFNKVRAYIEAIGGDDFSSIVEKAKQTPPVPLYHPEGETEGDES